MEITIIAAMKQTNMVILNISYHLCEHLSVFAWRLPYGECELPAHQQRQ